MNAVRVFPRKIALISSSILLSACLAGVSAPASAAGAKRVVADYNISFNGLGIGQFKLASTIDNNEYRMEGRARISVLAGIIFDWRGDSSSSGRVFAKRPRPDSYSFGYATSDKREKVDVEFSNNNVKQIAVSPPQKESASRVPVTQKHMRNVVDPLSAVIMLTNIGSNKSGEEVCTRRLPIFDGKARYDIKLSYKKTKTVDTGHGYKGPAYVCKVKFQPIAGHRRGDDEANFAAKTEGMEIWMVPLKEADLYVPYYIYLPTPVGTASLTSSGFTVESAGVARGALLQ